MFYSKSTGGFYDAAIHGARKLNVVAPGWESPQIEVPDPEWIAAEHPEDTPVPIISISDPDAIPETIEIDNPGCKIPIDAVEISAEWHAELMAGQAEGKVIAADLDGRPTLADPPPPTVEQIIQSLAALVQSHLDAGAQAMGYDNIFTAVTYADEPAVARFQTQGQALRKWRSQIWEACYSVVNDVQAGNRPVPSAEELMAELPVAPKP